MGGSRRGARSILCLQIAWGGGRSQDLQEFAASRREGAILERQESLCKMRVSIAKLIGGTVVEPSWTLIVDVTPEAPKFHEDEYRMQ